MPRTRCASAKVGLSAIALSAARSACGLAVEESNPPVQIAALRRIFAGEHGGKSWIETLPRRGYRFVGPEVTPRRCHQLAF
jgi:hypothetical protein